MRFGASPVRIPDVTDIGPTISTPAAIEPAPPANVVEKPMPRTLRRVPPRVVNVNARLADPLPAFDVHGMPLTDFLSLMSDLSTIPISVDADAIAEMGQSFATPVQLKLEGTSVANVLDAALAGLKLGYHVQDGQLIVGYPPQQNLRDIKFVVADLVGADEKPLNDLAALVRRMAAPQSWQPSAGAGSMKAAGGVLVSHQTDPVQMEILVFCEKLRIARGLPQKSRFDPARFVLTTRSDKARQMLQRPITANFGAPQSLAGVFKWLHQTTGATILVDHAALARQEMSTESECTAVAVNQPLATFLDELLTPIDLAWRVIDDRTVEITTRAAAAAHLDLEFYPARDLAADAEAGQRLIAQIQSKIEPQTWGDKPDQAAIQFDAPSRSLIVRAPQKTQAEVATFISGLGKK
jgi:hypothetical protein